MGRRSHKSGWGSRGDGRPARHSGAWRSREPGVHWPAPCAERGDAPESMPSGRMTNIAEPETAATLSRCAGAIAPLPRMPAASSIR